MPDPRKWPNGIKAVSDQIHNMGLKFGLYGCAGDKTCAGYPGSEGHEASDVAQLTGWGVDFWYERPFYPLLFPGSIRSKLNNPSGNTTTVIHPASTTLGPKHATGPPETPDLGTPPCGTLY